MIYTGPGCPCCTPCTLDVRWFEFCCNAGIIPGSFPPQNAYSMCNLSKCMSVCLPFSLRLLCGTGTNTQCYEACTGTGASLQDTYLWNLTACIAFVCGTNRSSNWEGDVVDDHGVVVGWATAQAKVYEFDGCYIFDEVPQPTTHPKILFTKFVIEVEGFVFELVYQNTGDFHPTTNPGHYCLVLCTPCVEFTWGCQQDGSPENCLDAKLTYSARSNFPDTVEVNVTGATIAADCLVLLPPGALADFQALVNKDHTLNFATAVYEKCIDPGDNPHTQPAARTVCTLNPTSVTWNYNERSTLSEIFLSVTVQTVGFCGWILTATMEYAVGTTGDNCSTGGCSVTIRKCPCQKTTHCPGLGTGTSDLVLNCQDYLNYLGTGTDIIDEACICYGTGTFDDTCADCLSDLSWSCTDPVEGGVYSGTIIGPHD